MKPACVSKHPLLGLLGVACLIAGAPAASPQSDRTPIPDPPRQREPWVPPKTKLPETFVTATATLFEQGMADPRGCEYREVELSDVQIRKTRGFVLPASAGQTSRFFVSWEGVVCRAQSIGAPADLESDIRALAKSMVRDRDSAAAEHASGILRDDQFISFESILWPGGGGTPGANRRSPLKVCLLLRLGRADLAEFLFAAGTNWTPAAENFGGMSGTGNDYLTLANHWAAEVFLRLMYAHMRGDDATALDAARRLSAFNREAATKADALGFQPMKARPGDRTVLCFVFLRQLPELLADQERRASEPGRPPIPGRNGDPKTRIAGLIRALDQIGDPQIDDSGGSGDLREAPLVKAVVAEGDRAVEPLLAACENDMRLTRSVYLFGARLTGWTAQPVYEAAFTALESILQTNQFHYSINILRPSDLAGRKELVRSMKTFWDKHHTVSLAERWYRTLNDDKANPNRWLEAADNIVSADARAIAHQGGTKNHATQRKPAPQPMAGEELRSRRDPSVSELLARRALELARPGSPVRQRDMGLHRACRLALVLDRWDETAALPLVKSLMARCRAVSSQETDAGIALDAGLPEFMARFTRIRARSGGRDGLGEYALWARTTSPDRLGRPSLICFEPMWIYSDDPAITAAARWLWNYPQSPWLTELQSPQSRNMANFEGGSLFASPLLRVGGFRAGLARALSAKSQAGTVTRRTDGTFWYKMGDGVLAGFRTAKTDVRNAALDVAIPVRVCDYLAWQISTVEGAPECELYWPEDRRDRAVESCIAFLKRYGDRFTAESPGDDDESSPKKAHLPFPSLGRPATAQDVKEARAIFSLEPPGEVRLAKSPQLPIPARWVTLIEFPVDRENPDGTIGREYDQDGWVWQAEEIRKGDRWLRYYGFVGRHTIARVPAPEIELRGDRSQDAWGALTGGLDARIAPVESSPDGYQPGRPIVVTLALRNRRGTEHRAPTEFSRRSETGQTAIRHGVTLRVFALHPRAFRTGHGPSDPEDELTPKRTDRFQPGAATGPLEPFESFETARFDLTQWFDLTQPGGYRLHIAFAADSGTGEGASNDWQFHVGSTDQDLP